MLQLDNRAPCCCHNNDAEFMQRHKLGLKSHRRLIVLFHSHTLVFFSSFISLLFSPVCLSTIVTISVYFFFTSLEVAPLKPAGGWGDWDSCKLASVESLTTEHNRMLIFTLQIGENIIFRTLSFTPMYVWWWWWCRDLITNMFAAGPG